MDKITEIFRPRGYMKVSVVDLLYVFGISLFCRMTFLLRVNSGGEPLLCGDLVSSVVLKMESSAIQ